MFLEQRYTIEPLLFYVQDAAPGLVGADVARNLRGVLLRYWLPARFGLGVAVLITRSGDIHAAYLTSARLHAVRSLEFGRWVTLPAPLPVHVKCVFVRVQQYGTVCPAPLQVGLHPEVVSSRAIYVTSGQSAVKREGLVRLPPLLRYLGLQCTPRKCEECGVETVAGECVSLTTCTAPWPLASLSPILNTPCTPEATCPR